MANQVGAYTFGNVVVIPAKRASRRLPGKNMRDCAGKPLVQWTIEAAIEADIGPVVVTTDWPELADMASVFCDVVTERPKMAGERTNLAEVVTKAITQYTCETVVMLQPTSPLRNAGDIFAAWLAYAGHDSLASYSDIGKHQELLTTNGAIWMTNREVLEKRRRFRGDNHRVFMMPHNRSVDIDQRYQLDMASALLLTPQRPID